MLFLSMLLHFRELIFPRIALNEEGLIHAQ